MNTHTTAEITVKGKQARTIATDIYEQIILALIHREWLDFPPSKDDKKTILDIIEENGIHFIIGSDDELKTCREAFKD